MLSQGLQNYRDGEISRYYRKVSNTIAMVRSRDTIDALGFAVGAVKWRAPYGQSGSSCYRYISMWRGLLYTQLASSR